MTDSRAVLEEYLASVSTGVDQFRRRISELDRGVLPVRLSPTRITGAPDEVLIGVGEVGRGNDDATDRGLCVNNKTANLIGGIDKNYSSITELVLNAPASLLQIWLKSVANDCTPIRFFSRFIIVSEDASPDSCFGLLCLLFRIGGIPIELLPGDWVDYIQRWERGEVIVGDSPYSAYGCLHNALVHASLDYAPEQAWLDGMTFLIAALKSGSSPSAIGAGIAPPLLAKARAFLAYEEQAYKESLRDATCVQLLLPLRGTKGRRHRLVDAYISEQAVPLGSLKAFCRTDRFRSFLKSGFALMLIYRSIPLGDGGDITISVDPDVGIELEELWREFEHLEDLQWLGQRPCDNPRRGLVGYPKGKRPDGTNAPNQPWFDGGDYTLIASPKRLADDGEFGSRLSWRDAREILWQIYHPFRFVRVRAGIGAAINDRPPTPSELRSLDQCFPETLPEELRNSVSNMPRFIVAGWYRHNENSPALRLTPTLGRYLAACIDRKLSTESIGLDKLGDDGTHDLLELPGGIAVITQGGAFLLDSGSHQRLDVAELSEEFRRVLGVLLRIESGTMRVAKLRDEANVYFSRARRYRSEHNLLERLSREQIEITKVMSKSRAAVSSPAAKRFREALLMRWGISGSLEAFASDVQRIKDVLHSRTDLMIGERVAFLQTYGFPIAISAALFGFVFIGLKPALHWPPNFDGIHWFGLALFALVAFFGILAMRITTMWKDRRFQKSESFDD